MGLAPISQSSVMKHFKGSSEKPINGPAVLQIELVLCLTELIYFRYNEYSRYRQAGACDSPPDYAPSFTNRFTQLVWQATERLGVAVVDGIVVARYHPPGNFPGEFATDVRCRNEKNQEIKVKRVNK